VTSAVLGVDLGGTKVRVAIAGPDGAILAEQEEPTARGAAKAIVAQVARSMAGLCAAAGVAPGDVLAAGLAVPVAIDPRSGRSWSTHNVPGFAGLDVGDSFERGLGLPVVLDNDGNLAALGEGRAGAAVGVDDFVVIVIGTGIGSGIVAGGRLVRGAHGGGGEIAFLPLGTDPWDARSRARGAFEAAVAGPAITARADAALRANAALRADDALRAGAGSTLPPAARLADIAEAAAGGDPLASRLLDEEARLIAMGITAVAAVVDPQLVILSGGVGVVPGLLGRVRAHVATLAERPPTIVTGLLGARAPLVGAIEIALERARGADPRTGR
jgi:predicted NBD/HSP70 family sugar kinase